MKTIGVLFLLASPLVAFSAVGAPAAQSREPLHANISTIKRDLHRLNPTHQPLSAREGLAIAERIRRQQENSLPDADALSKRGHYGEGLISDNTSGLLHQKSLGYYYRFDESQPLGVMTSFNWGKVPPVTPGNRDRQRQTRYSIMAGPTYQLNDNWTMYSAVGVSNFDEYNVSRKSVRLDEPEPNVNAQMGVVYSW